ncbi:hypothetical protein JHW43_004788 [Diplocarpon mali]|nr:hypothetical protein JHW43_004788 [Diplocarpon mali]
MSTRPRSMGGYLDDYQAKSSWEERWTKSPDKHQILGRSCRGYRAEAIISDYSISKVDLPKIPHLHLPAEEGQTACAVRCDAMRDLDLVIGDITNPEGLATSR